MALISTIIREGFKIGTRYASRYYAVESKAFNKLYTGFPQSRTIGRGVRHGLTAGSTIGSLIAPATPGNEDNGFQKIQQRKRFTSRKPYKTRFRQARCPSPGYNRFRSTRQGR